MLNFSNKTELTYLAELAEAFVRLTKGLPYFLAGATARDLLLEVAHNINPGRNTRDVDLAVWVKDWPTFESLRSALIESGQFSPKGATLHKLSFNEVYELDLIPFGAIEQADRTIAWPPDGSVVMSVFGFQEVFKHTLLMQLPAGQSMRVISLPALVVLKLLAWQERRRYRPGTDAHDIAIILRKYLDAGNLERLYDEAPQIVDAPNFDYEAAGAWLLGHDMAAMLPPTAHPRFIDLLQTETNVAGPLSLISDMPIDADMGLNLLQKLTQGFESREN
ncbi:MAG: nucleotidyl transferase AbiEii/AbiGii toxin family protein [Gammaproteobacteria bacterium]|nr:nucleotidyl transferase AbiEii/AbiGii toxin family protein [Gammaproteobacteria bacterium]